MPLRPESASSKAKKNIQSGVEPPHSKVPRRCMSRRAILALLLALAPAALHAHPVPKDNHDRTLAVHLTAAGVVVDYRLELDEYRAARDVRPEALVGVEDRKQFHVAFRKHLAPLIADNLS